MNKQHQKFQDSADDECLASQQQQYQQRRTIQEPLFDKKDPEKGSDSSFLKSTLNGKKNNIFISAQIILDVVIISFIVYLMLNSHSEQSCSKESTTQCNMCPTEFQDGTNQKMLQQSQQLESLTRQQSSFQENLSSKDALILGIQSKMVGDIQVLRNDMLPLQESSQQCSSCCQKITDTSVQTQALSQQIESVRSESSIKIVESQSKIAQLSAQQNLQQGEIVAIKSEITGVSTKTAGDIQNLRDDMAPLQGSTQQCCQKANDAQTETVSLRNQIEESNVKISKTETNIEKVSTQQGAQQSQIEQIKSEVNDVKKTQGVQSETVSEQETRMKKLESDSKAMTKKQDDVFNQQNKLQQDQNQLKQMQDQTDRRVDTLVKTQTAQQAQISTLKSDYTNLENRMKNVENDEDQTKKCIEKNNKQLQCKSSTPTPTKPTTFSRDYPIQQNVRYDNTKPGFQNIIPGINTLIDFAQNVTTKFEPIFFALHAKDTNWRNDYSFKRTISACTMKGLYECIPDIGGYENIKPLDLSQLKAGYQEVFYLPPGQFNYAIYFTCAANKDCGDLALNGYITYAYNLDPKKLF